MKIVCDECGAKYSIANEKVAGKVFKIRCKKCSNVIVVRGNKEPAAAAAVVEEKSPNKETKVFDYAGYDSPQDAMNAGEEGDWHLVIDQEQVGPMTSAEVRQRFAAGEIDEDSYIWKEGFADWERIPDVEEFSDLEDGGVAEAAAGPSDLFSGSSDSAGADLFGGTGGGSDLFGTGSDAVGEMTGEVQMSKEAEAQLKGQRNENSVLFSLGNLAALASDAPKPAASSGSGFGASSPGIANTGGSEGSGLIDIRSMASVYLADKQPGIASTPSGSIDDLPVFSQSAFESASPVLLPVNQGGSDKKMLYILLGVIGALLIGMLALFLVLKGGDDKPTTSNTVAMAEQGQDKENVEAQAPTDSDDTETEAAVEDSKEPSAEPEPPAEPVNNAVEASDTPDKKVAKAPTKSTKKLTRKEKRALEKERKKKAKEARAAKAAARASTPEPVAESSGGSCDEVTCLVEPNKACCKRYRKKSSGGGDSASGSSNLPDRPTKSNVLSGISKVKGRVRSCGDKHGGKGKVSVKIKIGSSGKVQSASGSGGGSALRSCVVSAVKRARFMKSQKGQTVNYPFTFR